MASTRDAVQPRAVQDVSAQGRIPELDGLRGMAILLVLLYQYITLAGGAAPGTSLYKFQQSFDIGWTGVDLFFVLSGFLIGGILLDARESPSYFLTFFLTFYARRFFALAFFSFPGFSGDLANNPEKLRDASFYAAFVQNSVKIEYGARSCRSCSSPFWAHRWLAWP